MPDPKEVEKKEKALKEYAIFYNVNIGLEDYSTGVRRPGQQLD